MVRKQVLRVLVDEKNYEIVCKSDCGTVEFIKLSDKQSRRKRDFIVFADKDGNETVRNLLEIVDNRISYISMNGSGIEDASFFVVLTNLDESVMHLRNHTCSGRIEQFSFSVMERDACMMQICIDLLDEVISFQQFMEDLYLWTVDEQDYDLESSLAVLTIYSWHYKRSKQNQEAIEKLRYTVTEIKNCIQDGRWGEIWYLVYQIHNLPMAILNIEKKKYL